jgi:hypothetical protein
MRQDGTEPGGQEATPPPGAAGDPPETLAPAQIFGFNLNNLG